jgi:hypothetical protein
MVIDWVARVYNTKHSTKPEYNIPESSQANPFLYGLLRPIISTAFCLLQIKRKLPAIQSMAANR